MYENSPSRRFNSLDRETSSNLTRTYEIRVLKTVRGMKLNSLYGNCEDYAMNLLEYA